MSYASAAVGDTSGSSGPQRENENEHNVSTKKEKIRYYKSTHAPNYPSRQRSDGPNHASKTRTHHHHRNQHHHHHHHQNPQPRQHPDQTNKPSTTNSFHRPNTANPEPHVYVLTLRLTPSISDPMSSLRTTYFPAHLNRTPAHLTIFHALPDSHIDSIESTLRAVGDSTPAFPVSAGAVFRMRRGVGVRLGDGIGQARTLRGALKREWEGWLSEQDRGGWVPHWTVMNKVDGEERVQEGLEGTKEALGREEVRGMATGLEVWRYDRGRWVWRAEFEFRGE
ncbi:hypothetical protein BU24DRAFT_456731 [Aaosphaeria arxii CBS 175.79]|uniref:LigT-like protein n=1 Tax=Aaosphaeria arxii CBS 175.79 TaxID=1450172 RepID=A0A6A5Y652_9PLEO|nr:uncharacterized protein BU24DRAFT_456731 [Aaosphaeria arxii CBS 175.79]KAF2020683.1 hypothetical protein BU24DRAFT_456731 [Aaosphaeria arxii CBS 175.79]